MTGRQRSLAVLRVLLVAVGTVCGAFAVNQMTLNKSSWPWWLTALLAMLAVTALTLTSQSSQRRANRATAEGGGNASAGNRGPARDREPAPDNEARAVGPSSVAQAGDDSRDTHRPPPPARPGQPA